MTPSPHHPIALSHRLAIFASGTGSNAKKIVAYFRENPYINVSLIVSNKKDAPVLDMARANGIETRVIDRKGFYETEDLLQTLQAQQIDFIVLAGFLWLMPFYLIKAFDRKIVNIHPALLPKYGGKGMYGMRVHEAVKAAGERETGITIHYVDEQYDHGDVILQEKCALTPNDSPQTIAHKVQVLEHLHFAPVIEKLLLENK